MSSIIIAISGASHSGKTTFINDIKRMLGDNVIVYDEVIRKYVANIDEIRKNPKAYFDLQLKIISEKVEQEYEALQIKNKYEDKIILIDRSLADSLYYYTRYVDVNSLDESDCNDYYTMAEMIIKKLNYSLKNVYDKVIFFHPIDSKDNVDEMRPDKLYLKQSLEAFSIKSFLKSAMIDSSTLDKLIEVNILEETSPINVLLKCLYDVDKTLESKTWEDFNKNYLAQVDKNYTLSNVITNRCGSLPYNEKTDFYKPFLFAGLYSTDIKESQEIMELCKSYVVDKEWNDSRCYPTGLYKKHNVMIVGEAPGRKGRALSTDMLKPSFIFTVTSAILRYSLLPNDNTDCPYITNLLKYAKPGNDVDVEDFMDNYSIFIRELELIQPSKIIALGKTTYQFLLENLTRPYLDKLRVYLHPAHLTYKGINSTSVLTYKAALNPMVYGGYYSCTEEID